MDKKDNKEFIADFECSKEGSGSSSSQNIYYGFEKTYFGDIWDFSV